MSPKSAIQQLQEIFVSHGLKDALRFLISLPEDTRRELAISVGLNVDDIETQVKELEDCRGSN